MQTHVTTPSAQAFKALREKNFKAFKTHLKAADLAVQDERGRQLLHVAASMQEVIFCRELLRRGAKVDATTLDGETPLHVAARTGSLDVTQTLVGAGASLIQASHSTGQTALHYAAHHGQTATVHFLLEQFPEEQRAVFLTNALDNDGKTVLHYAAFQPHAALVRYLLTAGAPVDKPSQYGYTALHFAARSGHEDVVTALLEHGANSHYLNDNGDTPLDIAKQFRQPAIITALLNQSIHLCLRDALEGFRADLHQAGQSWMNGELPAAETTYTQALHRAEQQGLRSLQAYIVRQLSEVSLAKAHDAMQQASEQGTMLIGENAPRLQATQHYFNAAKMAMAAKKILEPELESGRINRSSPLAQLIHHQWRRLWIQWVRVVLRSQIITEPPDIAAYQEQIRHLRVRVKHYLAHPIKYPMHNWLPTITQTFIDITREMSAAAEKTLNNPQPPQWALAGLGSMSRYEMSLFSDLECMVLLADATPDNQCYAYQMAELLTLQIIALEETPCPILAQGKESPLPTGFRLDEGGNTPFGVPGIYQLIDTPEGLAQWQTSRKFSEQVIVSNALKHVCYIAGETSLVTAYQQAVKVQLDKDAVQRRRFQTKRLIRHQQALETYTNSPRSKTLPINRPILYSELNKNYIDFPITSLVISPCFME